MGQLLPDGDRPRRPFREFLAPVVRSPREKSAASPRTRRSSITLPLGSPRRLSKLRDTGHARLDPVPLLAITFAHLAACMLFIGAHNYAHSHFHDYVPPSWSRAPCTPVPRAMREYLHEHHERHHTDARTNLCTILLGFDYLAGTVYEVPVGLPEPSSEVAGEAALFAPPPSKLAPAAAAGDAPDFGMQLNELLQGLPAPAPAARLQRSKSPMRPGRVLHPCL